MPRASKSIIVSTRLAGYSLADCSPAGIPLWFTELGNFAIQCAKRGCALSEREYSCPQTGFSYVAAALSAKLTIGRNPIPKRPEKTPVSIINDLRLYNRQFAQTTDKSSAEVLMSRGIVKTFARPLIPGIANCGHHLFSADRVHLLEQCQHLGSEFLADRTFAGGY